LSAYPNLNNPAAFKTQAARGAAYLSQMTQILANTTTTSGSHPYIGQMWFDYADLWSEHTNWGLIDHLDNAYDGHEDVTATVSCSAPLQAYNCGGDTGNYGDVITSVKAANALWLGIQ